jgi:hypothetical protein
MPIVLTAEERDALYLQTIAELTLLDDLRQAWETGDVETAFRLGRRCSDCLRLIVDGLGWGDQAGSESVELQIPPAELRRILSRLRDSATLQVESERSEQEAFRATWERAGMVRDTCTEKLEEIRGEAVAAAPEPGS